MLSCEKSAVRPEIKSPRACYPSPCLIYSSACSVYANTAIKGEVAADNALYLGSYSAARDGAVVFSGVGHEVDDENYLATKVGA